MALLYECKSDESPSGPISVTTCRQARGHADWYKASYQDSSELRPSTIVVSPRTALDPDAVPHSVGLHYSSLDAIRELAREAAANLRAVRSQLVDLDIPERLITIQDGLGRARLDPVSISTRLLRTPLASLG